MRVKYITSKFKKVIPKSIKENIKNSKVYNIYIRKPYEEKSMNINHQSKFFFIHIPKTAGTSIKKALGLQKRKGADHSTPTKLVHLKTWETYFSFCVVRNPWDRLISSYKYHISQEYRGAFYIENPYIHAMRLEDYFDTYKYRKALRPQVHFIRHNFSTKQIDFICRFENLGNDFTRLCEYLDFNPVTLPHINKSNRKEYQNYYSIKFKNKVGDFYKEDIERFNYSFEQ